MSSAARPPRKFYGKYRGKVTDNRDPLGLGRVMVECVAVFGEGRENWAEPCSPYAGAGVGLFLVPPVDAQVWVEFEAGDPQKPILGGCFWGAGEVPVLPGLAEVKVLKTGVAEIRLSELPTDAGLTVTISPPAVPQKVTITAGLSGVAVSIGRSSIKLTGFSVSINDGALEVT